MNSESFTRKLVLTLENLIVLLFPKISVVINLSILALSVNPTSKAEPPSLSPNLGSAKDPF